MVSLTKVYTRGGDSGRTSLVDGTRVPKHDLRVAAYGTVDETNSVLGLVRLHTSGEIDHMLARIQNDLFDIGADLCTPAEGRKAEGALRVVESQVVRLEQDIDTLNAQLKPLTSFVLPGARLPRLICISGEPYAAAQNGIYRNLLMHILCMAPP